VKAVWVEETKWMMKIDDDDDTVGAINSFCDTQTHRISVGVQILSSFSLFLCGI
jgi:hypothetical protein